jgi:hypothetical protein
VAHPVLSFEEDLRMALKQKLALAVIWLAQYKPERTKLRVVVFNKPRPDAQALLFTFNGVSFNDRFVGLVKQNAVEVQAAPVQQKRIITP